MGMPACYVCGRQSRKFLLKFEVEDRYICQVCENAMQVKRKTNLFPGKPDYEFSSRETLRMPHARRSKMIIYSNEELTRRYEEEVLALEEKYS